MDYNKIVSLVYSAKKIVFSKKLEKIRACGFSNSLEEIVIPEGVKIIDTSAFWYCKNLKKATLPNSIEEIGAKAFAECPLLTDIELPENLVKPVSELHELTFYSYRHLNRLFKEHMGETLHDHVMSLKMNYGAMLLRTTDMGILEISSACGYDSLSHFIKMFKRHFKMTPKEYRRSFKYFPAKGI